MNVLSLPMLVKWLTGGSRGWVWQSRVRPPTASSLGGFGQGAQGGGLIRGGLRCLRGAFGAVLGAVLVRFRFSFVQRNLSFWSKEGVSGPHSSIPHPMLRRTTCYDILKARSGFGDETGRPTLGSSSLGLLKT